jgi:hypothetical protein
MREKEILVERLHARDTKLQISYTRGREKTHKIIRDRADVLHKSKSNKYRLEPS